MNKTKDEIVLTTGPDTPPVFRLGSQKFCLLNLTLDVEINGVTYHLRSEFSEKPEMGQMIDTIELERSNRKPA